METNILRHSIFFEETVFNETTELNIDTDINLPDYCGPIKKILKCRAVPRVTSKSISGQNLLIDGTININVLYSDDSNCIKSYEHIVPIEKGFELNNNFENCNISCKIKSDFINCRALTESKISVHGSASINVVIKTKKPLDIITDIDNTSIELLKDDSTVTIPMGEGEKNLIVEEEISIGNGQASVESLLRYDIVPIVDEIKIISNKVIVKGNLRVYILYSSHEGTRQNNFSVTLPFSQIVDIEGVTEGCKCDCDAQVVFSELKQRAGDDECRSFLLTAKLLVCANAYCTSEIPVIIDAYSTNWEISSKKTDVTLKSIKETINDSFVAKKSLEFSDGSIGSIIDLWCDCDSGGYKMEGNAIITSGRIVVHILAYDADGAPMYFERPIDFDYKFQAKEQFNSMECKIIAEISNCSFTIVGANQIEVTVELKIIGSLYDSAKRTLITDIEILDDKKKQCDYDSGILIYFAKSGENLWDIAKKYNSCKEEIMNMNNCSDLCLTENKNLIIPIK